MSGRRMRWSCAWLFMLLGVMAATLTAPTVATDRTAGTDTAVGSYPHAPKPEPISVSELPLPPVAPSTAQGSR
ncbi:hypothetical protein [Streptomyces lutosisoli]|uniref:Secreted protein n=1 Tax=Streptomyces lutosisoli TaxID=2665721 RepID=A0ABW2VVK3_9ACTN